MKRILVDADLWPQAADSAKKGGLKPVAARLHAPGQTLNIDLCFVPTSHETVTKLPAVSGSSGRLVIEHIAAPTQERHWPGQVFADESRDYAAAMLDFVAASRDLAVPESARNAREPEPLKAQKRTLRREEAALQDERRDLRQRRQLEDAAWAALKGARKTQPTGAAKPSAPERKAQDQQWRILRDQRRAAVIRRKEAGPGVEAETLGPASTMDSVAHCDGLDRDFWSSPTTVPRQRFGPTALRRRSQSHRSS